MKSLVRSGHYPCSSVSVASACRVGWGGSAVTRPWAGGTWLLSGWVTEVIAGEREGLISGVEVMPF